MSTIENPSLPIIASPESMKPERPLMPRLLKVAAFAVAAATGIFLAHHLGIFPTEGPNP